MTKTFRLANGITCVSEERPGSGKVSMQILVKMGSANEAPEENGLTFLMQESTNGGTTTRSRIQLAEAMESKGSGVSTGSDQTKTIFGTIALTGYAREAFPVLADMVRNPAFNAKEIEKTKTQITQMLEQQSESPGDEASLKFSEAAFSGQPMGKNPMGTKELLASFTPEQVKQKHAALLAHPENIVVSFTGDITAAAAEKLTRDYFGDLPAAATPAKKPQMNFTGGDIRKEADNDQIKLQFGFPAPPANSADEYASMMLQEYLSGGMSSPLFQEVREKRGLVYGIGASYAPLEDAGLFKIITGAGKGNAGELISVTMDVLGKVIREGVSQTDLDQARERWVRGRKGVLEAAGASCSINADQVLSSGNTVSLEEYDAKFKKVTSDDLRRVCASMLKGGAYALAGVGPQETMPSAPEIKAMMQAQVQGVTIPAAKPAEASAVEPFAQAAKKTQIASVEPKTTVLKNGIVVTTVERPGNLSCGIWVGVGSDNETEEQNGGSHMFEHLPFKGTDSYGPGEIDRIIEAQLGGDLNAYTSKDQTAFYFYNLEAGALPKVIDICGEMVFKPTLNPEAFNGKMSLNPDGTAVKVKGERDVVIEELNMYNDEPDTLLDDIMMQTAYPGQPHGRPILGTEKTLRAMTVEGLAAYHDEGYVPNNMTFCLAGTVRHEDFVALVESKYGHLPAKKFPTLPAPMYKGGTVMAEHRNAALCTVALMAEGISSSDPDITAYEALGVLLGGGVSSRLNKKAVIEQELTAEVDAGSQNYRNGGAFMVSASMTPERVKPFVTTVYAEMCALNKDLTQAELDKAKAILEMALLSSVEVNRKACYTYAKKSLAYGRLVKQTETSEQIQKLTVGDIKRVLGKVLASTPTLALVAPPGTSPRYLPKLDEVIALRDGKAPPKNAPQQGHPKP